MFVGLLIAWANEPMPDWSEYTEENHIGMAQCCHVPVEKVRVISRDEYEENTD